MQLTSLEIFGFKSFADRQKFIFDKGITGIVGPNGCGKSNIVDSIRWVLGEQRTKNLRSDKMENVIFNGTKARRKSSFAEVSLNFENTRNLLPTEYTNVKITRKLYRSGDSEYLINGVQCRLKDIHGLFMDTGIASDSYAIIELKMVDEILTNKDNERRRFFEEAAGISKYKLRKKQTLRKLKDTDADLERVEDLLFEIEKNLKSLEKQARRTQRYFELKEKYKSLSSQYAFLMIRSIRDRQKQINLLEQNLVDQFTAVQAELAQKEARLADLKKELIDKEKDLSHAQSDLNGHIRRIQSVETEKSIKNERLKYLQQRELAIVNQIDNEKGQLERSQSSITQIREDLARVEKERSEQQRLEARLSGERTGLQKLHTEQQQLAESYTAQHRDIEQEQAHLTREKEIKRVQIESLQGELERAEEDKNRRSEDMDVFVEKARQLETETESLERQFQELETKKNQHEEDIRNTEDLVSKLKDAVYKTNRLVDAKQNEHNLTKSLVESLEGFPASVKFLKKNAKWIQDAPLLSDIFSVPDEYKVAFENYLDPWLSYYVVKTRKDAILSIHMLADAAKGRANFLILDELESYKPSNPLLFTQAKSAIDLIEYAPEYKKLASYLFDQLYLVANESDIPDDLPPGAIFMTRTGNVSRRQFTLGGGSSGLFEGKRLGRAKNLEKLDKEIAKLQMRLTEEKVQLDEAIRKLDGLRRVSYTRDLETLRRQLTEKQRDLHVLQTREKEHKEFLARVGKRTEDLRTELEDLRKSVVEIDPRLKMALEELQQLTSKMIQQQDLAGETQDQLNQVSQQYNQEHIRLIHLDNQFDNLQRELELKEDTIQNLLGNNSKLGEELSQVRKDTDELINSNLQDDEQMVVLYKQKKEMEDRVERFEERVGMTKNSITQVEETMSGGRKRREEIQIQQNQMKESGTDIKLELNSLRERMSVEFQVDINALDPDSLFDKPIDDYDIKEIEEQVLKIRSRVQSFGEINPMAVEAFNEMKERHDFINTQKADLLDAKNSLLNTIAEIDETARAKFLETFALVRENFTKVFRTLFQDDDKCDLLLLDEENPLESDIDIIARPKGKRPQTIKQLSGGEKTLTAVALLFAFYLIKPAPFCIFDEVDAPLDDANIDKFNNIIREFSGSSQFIIVTHNKRTMDSVNVLYGVTQQVMGVSSAIPVSYEEIMAGA
ncbi:chromosome segregation protein SMC [Pontibacter sp. G13]|uniref:chromosome segregation protein SMC n=1 Tax=Pontibacter sp. G13 TaxID=3074898 RepID=UPI0028891D5C|nr:chromosome segregation protein SMC [Pontibacter sp. G13]WNJ20523.1 chromosome segregation protein SMC [Pontibacter sp. G13]